MALGGVLAALLLAELAIRVLGLVPPATEREMYVMSDDALLNVELRPGADFDFEGVAVRLPPTRVTISSQGLRDREYAIPKPAGTKRLLCVGDSFTFGWGVEEPECWCARLETHLGPGWEVVNLGVPGYSPEQQARFLELRGLQFEPDLVVTLFNMTDFEPPIRHPDPDELGPWMVDHSALVRWIFIRTHAGGVGEDPEPGEGDGGGEGAPSTEDPLDRISAAYGQMATLAAVHGFTLVPALLFPDRERELVELLEARGLKPYVVRDAVLTGRRCPTRDGTWCGALEDVLLPRDHHLNAEGNRRLALLLDRELRRRALTSTDAGR